VDSGVQQKGRDARKWWRKRKDRTKKDGPEGEAHNGEGYTKSSNLGDKIKTWLRGPNSN